MGQPLQLSPHPQPQWTPPLPYHWYPCPLTQALSLSSTPASLDLLSPDNIAIFSLSWVKYSLLSFRHTSLLSEMHSSFQNIQITASRRVEIEIKITFTQKSDVPGYGPSRDLPLPDHPGVRGKVNRHANCGGLHPNFYLLAASMFKW